MIRNYTGKAWKHHLAMTFIVHPEYLAIPNGAGKGGTVFTDYQAMLLYLESLEHEYYIAELDLVDEPLDYVYDVPFMANATRAIMSEEGFGSIQTGPYALVDDDANYFDGEIFLGRACMTDDIFSAKIYNTRTEVVQALEALKLHNINLNLMLL